MYRARDTKLSRFVAVKILPKVRYRGEGPTEETMRFGYDALNGLKNITYEDACTLPREWKEEDVEPQISRCKLWWEQAGKFEIGPQIGTIGS